jgi:hypothetical protein
MDRPPRLVLFVVFFGAATLLFASSLAETFFDDFNRPDGPLEDPWFVMNDYLYIESQRVVAHSDEFGNMGYLAGDIYLEASIEADINFCSDSGDGRFHLYTGGGESETDTWGYAGIVGTTFIELRQFFPEEVIATADYSFDTTAIYHATLAYRRDIGMVSLIVVADDGEYVVGVETASYAGTFRWCAIGIENLTASQKWLDNVTFTANGPVTAVPDATALYKVVCYPNPFNPQTNVTFQLARAQRVTIEVFGLTGERIARLADGMFSLGSHRIRWDGCDDAGRAAASGTYVIRCAAGNAVQDRKVQILR